MSVPRVAFKQAHGGADRMEPDMKAWTHTTSHNMTIKPDLIKGIVDIIDREEEIDVSLGFGLMSRMVSKWCAEHVEEKGE